MGMTPTIDITTEQRRTVLALLNRHLPDTAAWACGSRVKGTSRPTSDLDLVVFAGPKQSAQVAELREAFEESNLPFRVDLFVWDEVPESFRKHIEAVRVVLIEDQTEAEYIQSGWQEHRVSDLVKSDSLEIGDGYRAKNTELAASGVPFARAGNIKNGFEFNDADYFPEENMNQVKNKRSRVGDVVFTSKGTVGRFAYVRESTPRFVYSPQLCFWRSLNPELLDSRFLFDLGYNYQECSWMGASLVFGVMLQAQNGGNRPRSCCAKIVTLGESMAEGGPMLPAAHNTLLPKLISGEMRVRDAEKIVGVPA